MKKLIIFGIFLFVAFQIHATGTSEITIVYQHGRIPYNVTVKINRSNISAKDNNMEREIEITEEYFETLYQRFININYNIIIDNSKNLVGADGNSTRITIGTYQNKMEIILWTINYREEERKTTDLLNLIKEVFALFDLYEFIFE
ncbi:MAG: hypothetical protein LBQ94_06590 [Treponema sp.]|nr:hypothetical protein [Treponema sp.]